MSEPTRRADADRCRVPWTGYAALVFAVIFFSGLFAGGKSWTAVLDFNALNGQFGTMKEAARATFYGMGGQGARDGFLFAFSLVPAVMLALGVVEVVEHLGGLRAAQRLLTPVLRPLLGLPGVAGLALISSLQSTDAGASMTKTLREDGLLTEREKTVFAAFQFTAGGTITNYLSTGSALFAFISVPILIPLVVIMLLKVCGANIMRLYLRAVVKGAGSDAGGFAG
ncbi:MAG: nucleoside recognition domain-containing protein [Sporomusaceae bacterium]|nr:nucleoside recognition domain-containing protein [Sporomusaceae bacterium]